MIGSDANIASVNWLWRHAGLASAALVIAPLPGNAAELCPAILGSAVAQCESAPGLAQDLLQGRADRTLATDPAQDRINNRLNGSGTTKKPAEPPAPFLLTPDGDKTNFTTSLTQWGSALSAADLRAIEQAKTKFGKDLVALKPVAAASPNLDVWAQTRHEPFRQTADAARAGEAITTYVGADYRMDSDLLLGAMVQVDDTKQSLAATHEGVDGEAFMAGPYLAYRLTPNLVLGAKAAWGEAYDSASFGAATTNFATERMLSEARVSGNWGWGKWQLVQTAAVTYLDETASASIPGLSATNVEVSRFSTGPELKRQIDVGLGNSVEPFAYFRATLDLDEAWMQPGGARSTVGGGVMLSKPDRYNIRATADYTESTGVNPDESVAGKVSVSVPLR